MSLLTGALYWDGTRLIELEGCTMKDVGVQSISPDAGGESIFTDCEGPTN